MNANRRIILKVPDFFSKSQVGSVIVLTLISFWGFINVVLGIDLGLRPGEPPLWFQAFICLILAGGYWVLYQIALGWVNTCFEIDLEHSTIRGWNLFRKEFRLTLEDVVMVQPGKAGFDSLVYIDINGNRFEFNAAIDYNGFLHDYILTRLPPTAKIDHEHIRKLRERPAYWKYCKQFPVTTRYGVEYIEWLKKFAEDQRQALVTKGVLRADLKYSAEKWEKLYPQLKLRGKL